MKVATLNKSLREEFRGDALNFLVPADSRYYRANKEENNRFELHIVCFDSSVCMCLAIKTINGNVRSNVCENY